MTPKPIKLGVLSVSLELNEDLEIVAISLSPLNDQVAAAKAAYRLGLRGPVVNLKWPSATSPAAETPAPPPESPSRPAS